MTKYLRFLKKIKEGKIIIKYPYENFDDEINYYLPMFNKDELAEFNLKNFKSQKDSLIELLKNILYSINNNSLSDYKNSLENINYIYNQPYLLDSSEMVFFRCKMLIISSIKSLKSKDIEDKQKVDFIKNVVNSFLNNQFLEKQITYERLIPLLHFLDEEEEKDINQYNFFYNLINAKKLDDYELIAIVNENNFSMQKDSKIIAKGELYKYPNDLCFQNIFLNKNLPFPYDKCELYNFEYLKKNPPLKIDIDKIKDFLRIVFKTNVFQDLFSLLTGRKDYNEIYNSNMINYIIDNIKFLPLNYSNTSAFFDHFSFVTYISTMKKIIFHNTKETIKFEKKIIPTLENGVIIENEFHEFGHSFYTTISFIGNKESLMDTPRKKNFKLREGGYYVEIALFGKILKTLSYEEACYILNVNNYNKSLEEFRNDFEEKKENDLNIEGPFSNLNLTQDEIIERKNYSISNRGDKKKDLFKKFKINIPLKIDKKGRDFSKEDIEYYTTIHH